VLIEQVLQNVGIVPRELSAVAISGGPGSYTGLRIGTSAGKGLCQALGIPLIAVPTLLALAARAQPDALHLGGIIRPLLDARRDEVYTAAYSAELVESTPTEAVVVDAGSFAEELAAGPVLFLGDGALKVQALLAPYPNAHFYPHLLCSAASLGTLAWARYQAGQFDAAIPYEPFYLKSYNVGPPKTVPVKP
jgi:tRNA threonylcarbamoyladenosine biosynthesis protein TsaB